MRNDGMLAYLRWALGHSVESWNRVDAYIALATYFALFIAALIAPLLAKWNNEIETGLFWAAVALAGVGVLALFYQLCFITPRSLWRELTTKLEGDLEAMIEFMRTGRDLRETIGNRGGKPMEPEALAWEQKVYDWLAEHYPDFSEPFLLEMPDATQQYSPNQNLETADWLNRMDRRQSALNKVLIHIRSDRTPLQ